MSYLEMAIVTRSNVVPLQDGEAHGGNEFGSQLARNALAFPGTPTRARRPTCLVPNH